MANKQQTALEWLKSNLPSLFIDDSGHYQELFKQAIQMEREQHISAYSHGWHDGQDEIINRIAHIDKGGDEAGLKHFNDTYGTKPSH